MRQYFMSDTRLAGWERMMMDPSRKPETRSRTRKKLPQKKLPSSRPVNTRAQRPGRKEGSV